MPGNVCSRQVVRAGFQRSKLKPEGQVDLVVGRGLRRRNGVSLCYSPGRHGLEMDSCLKPSHRDLFW